MASLNSIGGIHYEMMKRCYNEKSVAYKDYGAKGISVCPEWHDRENFIKWAKENGYVKGLSLNRMDSKGNYEPSNCMFGEQNKKKDGKSQYHKSVRKHREEIKKFSGVPDKYCHLRIYRIYVAMHSRCESKSHESYKNYGGRGIFVCSQWSGNDGFFYFYKWSMENGYKNTLTIDRIDNNKGYSPDNCQWVSMKEQVNNRRVSINFDYNGKKMNLSDIAKMNNTTYGKMYSRVIKNKMSIEEAIQDIKESE